MDKLKPAVPLLSRRRVFAGAGTAGALAAAAVVLPLASGDSADSAATATATTPPGDDAQGRYQLTQHVQRYYQTAKV
jgi:hypothetical protein